MRGRYSGRKITGRERVVGPGRCSRIGLRASHGRSTRRCGVVRACVVCAWGVCRKAVSTSRCITWRVPRIPATRLNATTASAFRLPRVCGGRYTLSGNSGRRRYETCSREAQSRIVCSARPSRCGKGRGSRGNCRRGAEANTRDAEPAGFDHSRGVGGISRESAAGDPRCRAAARPEAGAVTDRPVRRDNGMREETALLDMGRRLPCVGWTTSAGADEI